MSACPIGFIHIPKTGGSSFFSMLRDFFGDKLQPVSIGDFVADRKRIESASALSGHVPFYIYEAENPRRRLFTILREPKQRVTSHFQYILATPTHAAHAYIKRYNLSLAQCFDHPDLRVEMANFQTKLLGWASADRGMTDLDPSLLWLDYATLSHGEADRPTLERAKQRLSDRMDYAILESPAGLARLYSAITNEQPCKTVRENITGFVEYRLTDRDHDALEENNRCDIDLYEFAVTRLSRLLSSGSIDDKLRSTSDTAAMVGD